jgi:ABC-2 type transport system permease protein
MSLGELTRSPATAGGDGSGPGGFARRRGALRRLVAGEIAMAFRRRRNAALLAVLALAPIAIGVAVKVSTPPPGSDGPQFLNQITNNGLFLVFTALSVTVPLLIPLLVGVVAGDSIAGEAGTGTLRYLLTVPVTRGRLLLAKTASVAAFTAVALVLVAVVGIIVGGILFGLHGPTLLSGTSVTLADGVGRMAESVGYEIVMMSGFVAIGMFVTTLTEVPIAAMATTVGIAIVANVLDAVPQLGSFREALFTHQWLAFTNILSGTVDWPTLLHHWLVQLAYVAIFGALAWARFVTKDVTS